MSHSEMLTVYLRDHDRCVRLVHVDDWDWLTMLAAVSADPRSFDEFELAWQRYRVGESWHELPWRNVPRRISARQEVERGELETSGACDAFEDDALEDDAFEDDAFEDDAFEDDAFEDVDKTWLLIDLARQRLASNVEGIIPDEQCAFQDFEGKWQPGARVVWINFAPWWARIVDPSLQAVLGSLPSRIEPLDFRGILFGRALAADLASRMLLVMREAPVPATYDEFESDSRMPRTKRQRHAAERWYALTIRIHADWLMTPRDDLEGEPPRTYLHRGRDWAERQIHDREQQWSQEKQPPIPLDRSTHAYRFGPMARDEVVVYFELCRALIDHGWKYLAKFRQQHDGLSDLNEFTEELWMHLKTWLRSGMIGDNPLPPAEIIETSRCHMPQLAGVEHVDCDCPICRMMAEQGELFYPTFSGLDGHHLECDDEFAFSLWESRAE